MHFLAYFLAHFLGGGRTSLTLCQIHESLYKNSHLKSHPFVIARFGNAESKKSKYSVIARIYAVNSWQSTQKIKSARIANLLKSFLLLFCFCKKVESPYPLDSNSQRMKFLGCFGKSLNRLAIQHTTLKELQCKLKR